MRLYTQRDIHTHDDGIHKRTNFGQENSRQMYMDQYILFWRLTLPSLLAILYIQAKCSRLS
jgi:hypothetical protein